MKIKYLAISVLLFAACGVSKKTSNDSVVSSKSEVKEIKKDFNNAPITSVVPLDIPIEDLDLGKKLYATNCSRCHEMKDPSRYTIDEWNKILPEMFKRANVEDATKEKISKFIYTVCRK